MAVLPCKYLGKFARVSEALVRVLGKLATEMEGMKLEANP